MSVLSIARNCAAAVSLFTFLICTNTYGALIGPGQFFVPAAAPLLPGATVAAGPVATPFSTPAGPGHFEGILVSTAYTGDTLNPLSAQGALTFTYQIFSNSDSVTSIGRMTHEDFTAPVTTDVAYDATGLIPTQVDRSGGVGAVLGWNFSGASRITPGTQSALMIVRTNSTGAVDTTAHIIDGGVVDVATLGPDLALVIPEPATLSLIGLASLLAIRRRSI